MEAITIKIEDFVIKMEALMIKIEDFIIKMEALIIKNNLFLSTMNKNLHVKHIKTNELVMTRIVNNLTVLTSTVWFP